MSNSISAPAYNPAEVSDLSGVLDFYSKKILMLIEKAAPAQIISYDREKNRAVVQILNYSVTSEGENIQRKPLNDIPVFNFGAGGFVLSFPVKEGDIGFLYAADGDISVFKKLLQIFAPATYQKHKYKDGVFYPIVLNGFVLSADDKDAVVLSSIDGQTKISLKEGVCTVLAETINATATNANITALTTITGDVVVNGDITATGTITAQTKVISGNGATGSGDVVTYENGIVTG